MLSPASVAGKQVQRHVRALRSKLNECIHMMSTVSKDDGGGHDAVLAPGI